MEAYQKQLVELNAQFEADAQALQEKIDPGGEALEPVIVRPRKADITVQLVSLVWMPSRRDAAGQLTPAWQEARDSEELPGEGSSLFRIFCGRPCSLLINRARTSGRQAASTSQAATLLATGTLRPPGIPSRRIGYGEGTLAGLAGYDPPQSVMSQPEVSALFTTTMLVQPPLCPLASYATTWYLPGGMKKSVT